MTTTKPLSPGKLLALKMERDLPLVGVCDPTPVEPLYHYTGAVGLKGILETKHLRATHFAHLNDRDEIVAGERLVHSVAKEIHDAGLGEYQRILCSSFLETYEENALTKVTDVFVASLTELGNDLSQWRAYGGQGGGYSIGLRLPAFTTLGDKPTASLGVSLVKVEYDEAKMRALVAAELRRMLDGFAKFGEGAPRDEDHRRELWVMGMRLLLQQAGGLVTRYKSHWFAAEREWRIVAMTAERTEPGTVQFSPRPTGLVPFVRVDLFMNDGDPLDLASVYVGPTQDPDRGVHAAKLLVEDAGHDPAIVEASGIPLRW